MKLWRDIRVYWFGATQLATRACDWWYLRRHLDADLGEVQRHFGKTGRAIRIRLVRSEKV